MSKEPTSFRLSPDGRRLLGELARRLGVSRTAVLEVLIRQKARQEGIDPAPRPGRRKPE
jgi:hypothetical protein